ncbi:MAG: zinc-binding dehydrogenase [Armatimonadetes bacterium]|nr:zinc-binding dehydrogenase [Armatimonadota bacterium]
MKVRAAVLESVGGQFHVQHLDLAEPRVGEVRVRVLAVGVCHSDWHLVTGDTRHPMPLVPGHEGAGVVEEVVPSRESRVPSREPISVGDLVALNWAPNCGSCFYCTHDRPNLCETYVEAVWAGTMLDGTTRLSRKGEPIYHYSALACFAEQCVVPAPCCVKMPADLEPEIAAVIGCAVTTGVGSVINTAQMRSGSSVVVLGAGGVGLSTVMGAVLAGASSIIAVDPLESRRSAALALGATHVLPKAEPEAIRELTEGRGADYVFEAAGTTGLQEVAIDCARPGGVIVFSGLSPVGSETNIPGSTLVRQEKTVMGSYYGTANTAADFPLYARLYKEGKLPIDRLISHRYDLDQINEAYDDMLKGVSVRGVVVF